MKVFLFILIVACAWAGWTLYTDRAGPQFERGRAYLERSDARAVDAFTKAGLKGHAEAAYQLALLYEQGRFVQPDKPAAVRWFVQSTEGKAGGAEVRQLATRHLAELLADGALNPAEVRRTCDLLQRSADLGWPEAAYQRALLLARSDAAADREDARKSYHFAAAKGHRDAAAWLGFRALTGDGIAQDEKKAAQWLQVAAAQDHTPAQYQLGLCYNSGRGVPVDPARAAFWLGEAAKRGHAGAQRNLAGLYATGFGVTRDLKRAAQLYRQAADAGDARAQLSLAQFCERGWAGTKDASAAFAWYLKVAQQGGPAFQLETRRHLVRLLRDPAVTTSQRRAARGIWQVPAEDTDGDAAYQMGLLCQGGEAPADEAVALDWYRKAAAKNHLGAQYQLGLAYEQGRGVSRQPAQAVACFRAAATSRHADAAFRLGLHCLTGDGTKPDAREAIRWLEAAAGQDHAAAEYQLALCYNAGRGVAVDPAVAAEWLRKAAQRGHAPAQRVLAGMSATGLGVRTDRPAALQLYEAAAKQQDHLAQSNVAICRTRGWVSQSAAAERAEVPPSAATDTSGTEEVEPVAEETQPDGEPETTDSSSL
jgi:TPR repeat protein